MAARGFVGALQKLIAGLAELGEAITDHETRITALERFHAAVTPELWETIVKSSKKTKRKPQKR